MIATGGTGGHVYPALAVAESMIEYYPEVQLYFVGTVGGFERSLVERSGLAFASHDEVLAGPLHGVNPLRLASSLFKLVAGTFQALNLLRKYRPQAILSTGGWVSLPVALAARVFRVPMLIFLPDVEPGMTIKVLRLFASKVALTVPESKAYFRSGQTVVTGYPLRAEVVQVTREQGVAHFGLDPSRRTLLVFGGSRGSRAINQIIGEILPDLLDDGVQVIHITGTLDWERSQKQIGPLKNHPHYHAVNYLDNIGLAFAVADLAVCRAGASTLAEFPIFHLPSILIPLAYSWHYQQVNANYLAERGAALHMDENDAEDQLLPLIRELFSNRERLATMRSAAAGLAQPDGARNVAQVMVQLI